LKNHTLTDINLEGSEKEINDFLQTITWRPHSLQNMSVVVVGYPFSWFHLRKKRLYADILDALEIFRLNFRSSLQQV
jgi:hypothetical protein